jgi:hypothetical protein
MLLGQQRGPRTSNNVSSWHFRDIATSRMDFRSRGNGETKSIPARYSFTYVKDGNDCKIVDHHSSAVPSPPR